MLYRLLFPLAALMLPAFAATAASVDFPTRPVKLVVAWAPGGAADASARLLAEKLQAKWKQTVVVENRPGAAGAIGTDQVVRSAADGHTVLLNVSTLVVNEVTKPPTTFRLFRDLAPVSTLWTAPVVLAVSSSVPGATLQEVLKEAAKPDTRFSFGHHGEGTATHLIGERLNRLAGTSMVGVPYAGDGPMSQALLGGHVQMGFMTATVAERLVSAGKAKVVAQLFRQRSSLFPKVPTFGEQGYEEMDRGTWGRLFVPAGTPEAVVAKLSADIAEVLGTLEMRTQYGTLGVLPGGGTPAQTLRDLQSDYAYWQARARESTALMSAK